MIFSGILSIARLLRNALFIVLLTNHFLFLKYKLPMNLKPLSNHLFIEPIEEEKITKSGIVIPETAEKEKPIKGKVVSVGPGKLNEKGERIPMTVKIGDTVLFKKYGPDEIEIDGKKYLVGDEDDILAIIE